MKFLVLLPFIALATAIPRTCSPSRNNCPEGYTCNVSHCTTAYLPTKHCKGFCEPEEPEEPPKEIEYPSCGGFRIKPLECENPDAVCMDDPRVDGCGMACDGPGICVVPEFCGGIAGFSCPEGKKCFDDPRDDCDPLNGGADCGGICI
ncbi:hypothetical protein jhhlp_002876 [Lomentospora prolificans]|uniref:Uncharacterized protein n=1 Tax=Lomentospora prolificans TaxID=41688 RepID=A0A2N3NFB5_9PEZI|nr:hypothetical protein jhhlp_002876 [Lomentospora prolificans]